MATSLLRQKQPKNPAGFYPASSETIKRIVTKAHPTPASKTKNRLTKRVE
jgi:hypothetical protein